MLELSLMLVLSLGAMGGWVACLLGLPGNWFAVAMALGCWYFPDPDSRMAVGVFALAAIVVLAFIGELLEFIAGALGVKKLGGSSRSALLAMLGSLIGAIGGFAAGSAVPIVGNILTSLAGSALGALAGSIVGERFDGKDWDHAFQVGSAAFWGRIIGTLAKTFCGTCIALIFVSAIWF